MDGIIGPLGGGGLPSRVQLLHGPERIRAVHKRQTGEVPGGGGDGVDHSSVRPFHGSPVDVAVRRACEC